MNGHGTATQPPPKVWKSLNEAILPPHSSDIDFWWKLTGYHLARLIDEAQYPVDRQYEVLLYHYHWIVS